MTGVGDQEDDQKARGQVSGRSCSLVEVALKFARALISWAQLALSVRVDSNAEALHVACKNATAVGVDVTPPSTTGHYRVGYYC